MQPGRLRLAGTQVRRAPRCGEVEIGSITLGFTGQGHRTEYIEPVPHLASLLSVWAVTPCAVCHVPARDSVCAACVERFATPRPRCPGCAIALAPGVPRCAACLREPLPLAAVVAAVDYDYPWQGLIGEFKFRERPGWAGFLAHLLSRAPGAQQLLAAAELAVPMPMSDERLRERGYNPAWELARRLHPRACRADLLARAFDTPPQVGLSRQQRLKSVRAAYAATDPAALVGRRVLLVDDVMTTGASLSAAAAELRRAGACQVDALVLARTP